MSNIEITSKKVLDAINKYVYIVPSVKQAILEEIGLVYNRELDTKTRIDFRDKEDYHTAFLNAIDEAEDGN